MHPIDANISDPEKQFLWDKPLNVAQLTLKSNSCVIGNLFELTKADLLVAVCMSLPTHFLGGQCCCRIWDIVSMCKGICMRDVA